MRSAPSRKRVWIARGIALAADAVQILLLPLFGEGGVSPINDVLDVVIAGTMMALVGWHWAFLPAFVAELVPVFDLVPTWTAAVWFATRGGAGPGLGRPSGPEMVDVTPRRPAPGALSGRAEPPPPTTPD